MFFYKALIVGIIATLLFDLFQFSLTYAYNISQTKWNLVGRYIFGLSQKKIFVEEIDNEKMIKNELIIGYVFHYFIGIIFGLFYTFLNFLLYTEPSFFLALFVGFLTVLGSWCFMMPYVFNIGYFASKKNEQKQLIIRNLIAHFIFGIGLFMGCTIIF